MTLHTNRWPGTLLLLSIAAITACADDLKTTDNGDKGAESGLTISTLDKGDGVHETTVNASNKDEKYLFFDLDKPGEVDDDSADWDLAFTRFKIKTNGGDSGSGDVAVAKLEGESFDDLSKAPTAGYVQDSDAVSDGEGGDPSFAFLGAKGWYEYDPSNHQLMPADYVYVVRSTQGAFFKVKMLGYYDKAGTPGFPKFQWAGLEEASGDIEIMEQAGSSDDGDKPDEGDVPDAGDKPDAGGEPSSADPSTFGCYNEKIHVCDCDHDEAACMESKGIWTEKCGCD